MSLSLSAEQQLQRLQNQIGWVTRISTALSSTYNFEDVISVILAGLVSPTGLGYSQVLYFEYGRDTQLLHGKYALFHESVESIDELARELDEETRFMEQRAEEGESRHPLEKTDKASLEAEAALHSLTSSAQWVTLFQRLNPDNEVTRKLEEMAFPVGARAKRRGGPGATLFELLRYWRTPKALSLQDLGQALPAGLAELLAEYFVLVPLHSQNRLRAVLFVDKRLEDNHPAGKEELRELEWFARQASIAIENVEVSSDLSRAYQELKQLDQMKSNFLSTISHELRTPLTAIGGFVDLILEERVGGINENQRSLLGRVSKNTGHLSRLVNDLIEVAEIAAEGAVEVEMTAVEPLAVLMDTLPKLEQRRRTQDVHVVPVVEEEIPRIYTDERSLGRIYYHLIDNAMKFSAEGGTVEVRFEPKGDTLAVSVCDHGVGIPQENLEHIFTEFYQVDNTLTRKHEGLGLGLAVTKMLLAATHGRIEVESEPGTGSTFTIIYPVYTSREE